jgi:high-affinity K+ transport system ATPase subunit B
MILQYHKQYGNKWSKIAKKMKTRTGDMIKNRFYSSLKKESINNKSLLKKKRKRITSKCKSYQIYKNFNENISKIKAQEESVEIEISHKNKKKDGKNDIINDSKEENSENTNDKNEQNFLNISNIYTRKLIVIIDNYKILLEN